MTIPIEVAVAGLIVTSCGLLVAVWNYRRKAGVLVRGSFSTASSRNCDDRYVAEVVLENQKDRAITIFGIYLQVGYSYYVELEEFEEPLVLRPFESYHKTFGPIEFYAVSSTRVDLNERFEDRRTRKRLVLSTGDGRYVVRSAIRRWHPVGEFFRNHLAGVVRPIASRYKDRYLGSRVKYVVEFIGTDGKEEVVPIHPADHELRVFRAFTLTREALESREALENYLNERRLEGSLKCERVIVHDVDEWRKREHDFYDGPTFQAPRYNAFQFLVLGRASTLYSEWQLKRKNRLAAKAAGQSYGEP